MRRRTFIGIVSAGAAAATSSILLKMLPLRRWVRSCIPKRYPGQVRHAQPLACGPADKLSG